MVGAHDSKVGHVHKTLHPLDVVKIAHGIKDKIIKVKEEIGLALISGLQ